MNRCKPVELTNLCLITDGNRILVQEREYNGEKGIIFPGGHVEDGETLQASVIREIKEETGLTLINPISFGIKNWFNGDGSRYMVILYKASQFTGTLKSSREGRVFWVTRDEFEQQNVIWGMREILALSERADRSELFYDEENERYLMF